MPVKEKNFFHGKKAETPPPVYFYPPCPPQPCAKEDLFKKAEYFVKRHFRNTVNH